MKALTALISTDFGNPDGLHDHNIENYFLDQGYWNKIVESEIYFVIGRKGTGKSAIYNWIHNRQEDHNQLISNLSFRSFPFEKLLKLSDDDYSRPNQYRSIWKYIILSELAKQIVTDEGNDSFSDEYKELYKFVDSKFGKDLNQLHSKITTTSRKTDSGLKFANLGFSSTAEKAITIEDGLENISEINIRLENLITSYISLSQRPYLVQFDQLDDNYTLYIDNRKYFESLISLFKVLYELNASLRNYNKKVKVIAYLRSDIFHQFSSHDPDSAKFDFHTHYLNWAIINKDDWYNPPLLNLINIRIENSVKELSGNSSFYYIFNNEFINLEENKKRADPFRYIIHRTFHRPRDIIQFCIKTQEMAKKLNRLDFKTIKSAEKEYSSWLIDELKNEISPVIPATDMLFTFLRTLGSKPFSREYFKRKFLQERNKSINKSPEALLRYLYELGIIQNVKNKKFHTERYSIVRNEKSNYDPNMKAELHTGILKGLHNYIN
ncbi:MAG: hypothetical protein RIE52_00960 [Balneola sp.]|jgi:hypothetical protein